MLQSKLITMDKGRDAGKTYQVREMPVSRLEKWAMRALLAIFGADTPAELPSDVSRLAAGSNAAALVSAGLRGLSSLRWELVEPLYDELLGQIDVVPDVDKPAVVLRLHKGNLDNHVEDVATIVRLRGEVLGLSLNFLSDGGDWTSRLSAMARQVCASTSTSPAA